MQCLQVKRLHETFHEPFRKAMRQGPLSFSPTQAAARQVAGQQAQQTSQGQDTDPALSAVAAMPAIGMPMESVLEDADEDPIDLPFL